jgi:AAA family ATP:ADP antiporter
MPPLTPSSFHRILSLVTPVNREELRGLLWSFLCFFTLLASYYVLRPVRDEMGVQTGAQNLPWLFSAVFVSMLVLVPLFGWIAGRLPVRRLIPTIYLFFSSNLFLFFLALISDLPRTTVAPVFFVWVSVFNLFESARRLFGFIAAGGSSGAVAGPLFTALMVPFLGVAPLLLVSIGLLLAAMTCFFAVLRTHPRHAREEAGTTILTVEVDERAPPSLWIGLTKILQSRYLLGICLYLACYSVLSTTLYSQQMVLVPQVVGSAEERTQLFAWVDFAVNGLTVLAQIFLTGRLLAGLGVTAMLVLVPAFNVVGFSVFGLAPILAVLVVFGVLRRAGEFAIAKPTRETLFTVVSKEEKYQAKNVIDTVVHRGGDMASSWFSNALQSAGLTISETAFAAVPIAVLWLANGFYLGRHHGRIRDGHSRDDHRASVP